MTFRFNGEIIECSTATAIEMCYIVILAQTRRGLVTSKAEELENAIKGAMIREGRGIIE